MELVQIVTRNIPYIWKAHLKLGGGHLTATHTAIHNTLLLIKKHEEWTMRYGTDRGKGNIKYKDRDKYKDKG